AAGMQYLGDTRMQTRSQFAALALFVCLGGSLGATTLRQLSLDDMIRQSTAIVRAKVTGSYNSSRADGIWTFYRLENLESLKTAKAKPTEVAIPGGEASGKRQIVDGAPTLAIGKEYVLFIWVSRAGIPQVIGLSQGLFDVSGTKLIRAAATEPMM